MTVGQLKWGCFEDVLVIERKAVWLSSEVINAEKTNCVGEKDIAPVVGIAEAARETTVTEWWEAFQSWPWIERQTIRLEGKFGDL